MSMSAATGRTEERACATCAAPVTHKEVADATSRHWVPVRHDAPCGAPCLGGGIDSRTREQLGLTSMREAIEASHGKDSCRRCRICL